MYVVSDEVKLPYYMMGSKLQGKTVFFLILINHLDGKCNTYLWKITLNGAIVE